LKEGRVACVAAVEEALRPEALHSIYGVEYRPAMKRFTSYPQRIL
jgi:ABC-type hemin transport system ATPase subunit